MATGHPKKDISSKSNSIELSYEGKEKSLVILNKKSKELICASKDKNENSLYYGDNLEVLLSLYNNPEIKGKVSLIYIDPPYATQSVFSSRSQNHAYSDTLSGADFIEFLRKRLIVLRELLSNEGSIYLHLDEKMIFEMKIIMDEIFGSSNYKNLIVRKKCNPKNYTRNAYGNIADFILFYTKTNDYIWNKPVENLSEESLKEYRYVEEGTGRKFMKVPVHAPGIRNGETGGEWKGMMPPPGKHWQYKPSTLDEMDKNGEIFWSENGNPRRKVYLDTHPGVGVQDIWMDFKDAHNQNIKITGYPTEKNPELLERIIQASSNPGDLVLDCFAGSGTTLDVSSSLNRKWIGIDNSPEAIKTIVHRLMHGTQPMGDFVGKKNKKDKQQQSLFDLFDNDSNELNEITKTKKDIQFSIYTFPEKHEELKNLLDSVCGVQPTP